MPRNQTERADALEILEKALVTHGFGDRKFGTAYWAPIVAGYATLTGKARKTAATIPTLVEAKNEEVEVVDEVLSATISLGDAQYRTPAARQAKLRELGYQREYN